MRRRRRIRTLVTYKQYYGTGHKEKNLRNVMGPSISIFHNIWDNEIVLHSHDSIPTSVHLGLKT